jgi:alpha-glucoside transport system substrate-binding protein
MKKGMRALAALAVASLTTLGMSACAPSTPAGDGKVSIFGGYGEADAAAFQKSLTEFGDANGIEITFTSLAAFDKDIKVKIEAGQEPDIALWPQPGGLKDLAVDNLVPLKDVYDVPRPQTLSFQVGTSSRLLAVKFMVCQYRPT